MLVFDIEAMSENQIKIYNKELLVSMDEMVFN